MAFNVLTRDEAAKIARISPRHLDRLIAAETGPEVTRIGRRVLISSDSFREWIKRGAPSPPQRALVAATQDAVAEFATAGDAIEAVHSCQADLPALASDSAPPCRAMPDGSGTRISAPVRPESASAIAA
jgi:hypothetical protein